MAAGCGAARSLATAKAALVTEPFAKLQHGVSTMDYWERWRSVEVSSVLSAAASLGAARQLESAPGGRLDLAACPPA